MAKFVSIQVHKHNEPVVERIQMTCETLKTLNFNSLMNSLLPNLEEAIKTYNPTTRRVNLNLGNIRIR